MTIRVVAYTGLALVAFAANSLLCRWAIGEGAMDAMGFALCRATSGFVALALLTRGRWNQHLREDSGRWWRLLAWLTYLIAFSFSYLRLQTGVGALVLFGVTQLTMIGAGLRQGERPRRREWVGLILALVGLGLLTLPGADAPDVLGLVLMTFAGVGWGAYSLLGRSSTQPMASNCAAFLGSVPILLMLVWFIPAESSWSGRGIGLAIASGALTTALGYSLWYAALPALSRTRAAVVQLSVPILAAMMGIAVLGETASWQLVASGATVLGGIALAIAARHQR